METRTGPRPRDAVIDRLQTVKISERDREYARALLERADRVADVIIGATRLLRQIATPLRRAVQR